MRPVDPMFLPPGHPDGFAATLELRLTASKLLVFEYANLRNLKKGSVGYCVPDKTNPRKKKWSYALPGLGDNIIADEMLRGSRCFGVAHKHWTSLFVLDVDNPELFDDRVIETQLQDEGWGYLKYNSGKGRHFWVFFTELVDLVKLYGNGPRAMSAVVDRFLAKCRPFIRGRIDVRGCNGNLIKLPLQFDPVYRRIVMPYDVGGNLIEDFEEAVSFGSKITYNDAGLLLPWLERHGGLTSVAETKTIPARSSRKEPENLKSISTPSNSFRVWLDTVRVGPGDSNKFMYHFAWRCMMEGFNQDDVVPLAKELYFKGRADGRITCKDTWEEWESKAIYQAQKWWELKADYQPTQLPEFFCNDLEWIAKWDKRKGDDLVLSVILWFDRMNPSRGFYLSRYMARKWGVKEGKFVSAMSRFERDGLLTIIEPGKRRPPLPGLRGTATWYKLLDSPIPGTSKLDALNPIDLLEYYGARINAGGFPIYPNTTNTLGGEGRGRAKKN